jgi:hypothetical protein
MKTLKFCILALILMVGIFVACTKDNTPTTPADVNLKKGLLVYLPFAGSFADSSGNANPVTALNGATLAADEHGYTNQSYGGNGTTGPLLVTNNGSIKYDTAFSSSMNFMVFSNSPLQNFVAMTNWTTGYGPSFGIGLFGPNTNHVCFGVIDSTTDCNYWGKADNSNTSDETPLVPSPGSWYNMVNTYYKGTLKTYVNGTLISTKTALGVGAAALCPQSKMVIGGWWSGGQELINGRLDEVRLYNRVLNADEIAELSKDFKN